MMKILSSEMARAKSGLIRKVLIKKRGAEILANFARLPSYESPLKLNASLFFLLVIWKPIGMTP